MKPTVPPANEFACLASAPDYIQMNEEIVSTEGAIRHRFNLDIQMSIIVGVKYREPDLASTGGTVGFQFCFPSNQRHWLSLSFKKL
jgi:hypothetical protein